MQVKNVILDVLQQSETPMTFDMLKNRVKVMKPENCDMLEITLALEELIDQSKVKYLPSKKLFLLR